jgi:hypothetical protein
MHNNINKCFITKHFTPQEQLPRDRKLHRLKRHVPHRYHSMWRSPLPSTLHLRMTSLPATILRGRSGACSCTKTGSPNPATQNKSDTAPPKYRQRALESVVQRTHLFSLYREIYTSSLKRWLKAAILSKGRFIMFSVIAKVHNKKIKGSTLMELFTAAAKLIFVGN